MVGDQVACTGSGYASHAEYILVPSSLCVKKPASVSFEQASFAALGGIALEALRLTEIEVGQRIAVIGLGYVGLPLAIEFSKKSPFSRKDNIFL